MARYTIGFQYPLFRIEGLNVYLRGSMVIANQFQYPLFRIEGLNTEADLWYYQIDGFSIRSFGSKG